MSAVAFEFGTSLPAAYKDLLWEVFFAQRGRGISLAEHFPELTIEHSRLWCAFLHADGELLAGLVVKLQPISKSAHVGLIGLVCVQPAVRGRGLSTLLLQHTLDRLAAMGLAGVTLWTGKPGVYAKLGFKHDDPALFGTVSDLPRRAQALQMQPWPDRQERTGANRGLPPYAWYAQRISTAEGSASAIVIYDAAGAALAEWSGTDQAVADLLQSAMPSRWRFNALLGDQLPGVLASAGARVQLVPTLLQMWKHLNAVDHIERPRLRLLDRI